MIQPLISVIIPTFNRAQPLLRAVASVLAQSYANIEIIVVDDGSTDNTLRLMRDQFGARISLLPLPRNRGVSYARNRGIELSRGSFIAFLDSDDLWEPEKTGRQLAFMQAAPDILISQTDEIWIRHGQRVNPCKHHQKPAGFIFAECLPLCVVSPSAVMMRRRLFAAVGLFDETLPACEDYDLWLRIACRYPIPLLREKLVVKYGGHDDQLSRTIPALDRYRITSLLKLLASATLTPSQKALVLATLERKSIIYLKGCRKRGRVAESAALERSLRNMGLLKKI
ncbi:MAG: glycosyltransferase [Deltaproteobacteria bacterium]|nr:glycosyltransferase [Deltaproteobacteria bacterium]